MGETDQYPEIGEEIEVTVLREDVGTEAEIEIEAETEERIKEEIMKDLDLGQDQDLDTRKRVRKDPEDILAVIQLVLTLTPLAPMTPPFSSRNWSSRRWRKRRD